MDISTYWQSIKKQSKELTGVSKIDSGIFHSSGIGGLLEDYIKAVKAGKPKDIQKKAEKALTKSEKYLNTIHKKEVKEGKKALNSAQLKSAKIVGDALEKIIVQLREVVSGDALAGSFDGDASEDVEKSADPLDPVKKRKFEEHLALRQRMVGESKKVLAKYKADAKPIANLVRMANDGAKEAKASKRAGETFQNIQAVAKASRAVEEITEIIDGIKEWDKANVQNGSSPFMKARSNQPISNLPKWYEKEVGGEAHRVWKVVEATLKEASDYIRSLDAELSKAEAALDLAESFSMQGQDPAKLIAKIEKLHKDILSDHSKMGRTLEAARGTQNTIDMVVGDNTDRSFVKLKFDMNIKKLVQEAKRFSEAAKKCKTHRTRLNAILDSSEDRGVAEAAQPSQDLLAETDRMVKDYPAAAREAQRLWTGVMARFEDA
ncbi:hypothetical protein LNKW23_02550 [Paralimibaculum aggregatum]|uniref:Uncharacterized protein n=1 Tax=Paralimibaculum aggregatum TaxID=3036245 RepID=A0ABQ6LIP0_9RHOB|nr:hypothetical protein [Limibaculum sp. NKW23]GMG81043.1 hypothetical protein LNKW23_02550 [Limibaculum sp. NKW23]